MAMTFDEAMKASATTGAASTTPDVSKTESALRGFSNAATFGLAPKISAGANTLLGKMAPEVFGSDDYETRLREYLAADKAAASANPGTSLAASAAPSLLQAIATGGGSLARQAAVNTGLGALNAYGNSEDMNPLNRDVATAAGTSAALTALPGVVGKAAGKVADKISGNTLKNAVTTSNTIAREKLPGWKEESARVLGTSVEDMAKGQVKRKEVAETLKDIATSKDPLSIQLSDEFSAPWIRDVLKANTPTAKDLVKDIGSGILGGAAGSGGAAAINFGLGGPLDATDAAALGAIGGAWKGGGKLASHLGTKLSHGLSTSPLPEKVWNAAASRPVGAASQMLVQSTTKDFSNEANAQNSPFGKLSDYLSAFTDSDDKRKAAMELNASPDGRAVGNTDSPLRN